MLQEVIVPKDVRVRALARSLVPLPRVLVDKDYAKANSRDPLVRMK